MAKFKAPRTMATAPHRSSLTNRYSYSTKFASVGMTRLVPLDTAAGPLPFEIVSAQARALSRLAYELRGVAVIPGPDRRTVGSWRLEY